MRSFLLFLISFNFSVTSSVAQSQIKTEKCLLLPIQPVNQKRQKDPNHLAPAGGIHPRVDSGYSV